MNHPYQMQSLISLPYPNPNMCFYINNNPKLINSQNSFQSSMPNSNICAQANQISIQNLNKLQYLPIFSHQNYQHIPQQVIYSNIEQDNQQNQEYPITYQSQNYRFGSFKQNQQPDVSYQFEAQSMKSRNQPAQMKDQSQNSVPRIKKFSHSSEQLKYNNNHSCLISESQIGDLTCQSPSQKSLKISKNDLEMTQNSEKKFKQKENCQLFLTQKQEYNSEENEQTNYIQNNREINTNNEQDSQIKNQSNSHQNNKTFEQKQIIQTKNQKQQQHYENLNYTKNNNQSKKDNLLLQTKSEFELPINQNSVESQQVTQLLQDKSYIKGQKNTLKHLKQGKSNKKRIQKPFQDDHIHNQINQDTQNSQPSLFQAKLEEKENQNSHQESINNFSVKSQQFTSKFQNKLNNHQSSNNSENAQNIVNVPSAQCKLNFTCRMKEFSETETEQQQQYSSSQEPQLTKKYCKIRFLSDSSADDQKDMMNIKKQSEVVIICSVKPKDKIKKSKQDYYNDSNYTKNLLKGFRRYMKRFVTDQYAFQQFQIYFTNNQLNNEFILKLFSDNQYSSYFNKFLSQPPHWWIQEAKIKDVEKQINFFNLCKQKKISNIKTKRKSFERPQIYFM